MERKEAIKYLERKKKIKGKKIYNKTEEKEIEKIISGGKIYGDPIAEIQ